MLMTAIRACLEEKELLKNSFIRENTTEQRELLRCITMRAEEALQYSLYILTQPEPTDNMFEHLGNLIHRVEYIDPVYTEHLDWGWEGD